MKVLTKYPVYINKRKVSNADFYMNADDTLPTDPFSYTEGPSQGINPDKAQAIAAGVGAAAQIGTALLNRPKTLSEVEMKCGKRPRVGKKKKAFWDDCAKNFSQSVADSSRMMNPALQPPVVTAPPPPPPKDNKTLYIILGVLAVGVVGFFAYNKMKSQPQTAPVK